MQSSVDYPATDYPNYLLFGPTLQKLLNVDSPQPRKTLMVGGRFGFLRVWTSQRMPRNRHRCRRHSSDTFNNSQLYSN